MEIPGFYYDPIKKKYFKGSPPKPKQTIPVKKPGFFMTQLLHRELDQISIGRLCQFMEFKIGFEIDLYSTFMFSQSSLDTIHREDGTSEYSISAFMKSKDGFYVGTSSGLYSFYSTTNQDSQLDQSSHQHDTQSTLDSQEYGIPVDFNDTRDSPGIYHGPSSITSISSHKTLNCISFLGHSNIRASLLFHSKHSMYTINLPKKHPAWTSTWSQNDFIIGSTGCYFMVNPEQGRLRKIKTPDTDVFCVYDNNGLFLGCRNGSIYMYDHRNEKQCLTFDGSSPVSSIDGLCGNVLSCSLDGSIKEWDKRFPNRALQCGVCVNDILPMRLKVINRGQFFTGSDDGVVRVWGIDGMNVGQEWRFGEGGFFVEVGEDGVFVCSSKGIVNYFTTV